MIESHAKYTTAYHEPGRNDRCICGSGIKYKKCCLGVYSSKAAEQFRDAFNTENYESALIYARRWFTWYALSHKAHIIPFLESDPAAAEHLLYIDIQALGEILENLHLCYYRLKRSEDFFKVIERLQNVVQDKRWDAKISYTRGLWYSVDRNDDQAAYDALRGINIQTCNDPDFLALYLQVCPEELSLTEKIEIIDRILSNTPSESVKLQYRVVKAISYYLVCQQKEGDRLLEEAIIKYARLPEERKSSYGKFKLAEALEIFGKAANKLEAFKQGQQVTIGLIGEANASHFTPIYMADLHNLLGDFNANIGDYNYAIKEYSISLDLKPSELTKVFYARALCNNEQCGEAKKMLQSIDDALLKMSGLFDLAISWAIIAANSLDSNDIKEAKMRLKSIETKDPVFIQLRDQWIIDLLEATPKFEPGKIRKLVQAFNKYLLLTPNILGFGININRIIEDIDSVTQNKKR